MLGPGDGNPELAVLRAQAVVVIGLGLRSKSASIRRLAPAIEHTLALGYSLSRVLHVLEQAGLPPTPLSTLKSALVRHRAKCRRSAVPIDGPPTGRTQ